MTPARLDALLRVDEYANRQAEAASQSPHRATPVSTNPAADLGWLASMKT